MKLTKELREVLNGTFLHGKETVCIDEMACFLKERCPVPNIEALIEREYIQTARRFVASQRDARGRRRYYATDDKGIYANVDRLAEADTLTDLQQRKEKLADGILQGNEKLRKRQALIAGDISQKDWEDYLGERVLVGESE